MLYAFECRFYKAHVHGFMNIAWKVRKSNLLFYARHPMIFMVCSLNSDMFLPGKQWILFYYFFKILIEPKLVDNKILVVAYNCIFVLFNSYSS